VIDPDDPPRWWTVDEANDALARVGPLVERARQAARSATAVRGNGHRADDHDPAALDAIVQELIDDGIVLRDVGRGLGDFPARAPSGRGYWLCWLLGEPSVAWWHWPEDGFAGRTPLDHPPT
jgi:hypothetical protein